MKTWLLPVLLLMPLGLASAASPEHHPASASTNVSLSAEGPVNPGQPFSLNILIKAAEPLEFELLHEQQLHLIAVSSNLVYFKHLHPEYKGAGRFKLKTSLPFGGAYRLFLDYRPSGYPEQVKELSLSLPGSRPKAGLPDAGRTTQDLNGLTVNLKPAAYRAGALAVLEFDLTEAGQAVNDLEPYLGERGHLVIVRRGPEPASGDYLHTHAAPAALSFQTTFPTPGLYKLWLEFKRSGVVRVADFWVAVE